MKAGRKLKQRKTRIRSGVRQFMLCGESFAAISAVEGLSLSTEMLRDFREFDRKGLSAGKRRKTIVAKYGK